MKLQTFLIEWDQLQDYLDKYQDKIKFILYNSNAGSGMYSANQVVLIIDVA